MDLGLGFRFSCKDWDLGDEFMFWALGLRF